MPVIATYVTIAWSVRPSVCSHIRAPCMLKLFDAMRCHLAG